MDITTDTAVATSTVDAPGLCCYRPAVCSPVLQAAGDTYVEFTLLLDAAGDLDGVMLGVARATFDPTVSIEANGHVYGAYATGDGWMMETASGGIYHDYINSQAESAWVSGSGRAVQAGERVGMLLRGGSLSVYIAGQLIGVMVDGLVGEFVWAVDLTIVHDIADVRSVRIAARDAPPAPPPPCCSTICYPCGSGTACDFCDGSCNSAGPAYCDQAHPEWSNNCDRSC